MIKNRDSLKAKISKLAAKTNISNKYIIQTFMFEALLKRISVSEYKDKFIIKGGLLLSSIFGVNLRGTMDLDTTIKGLPLNMQTIENVFNKIISIDLADNVKLKIENIKDIRLEDEYSGFNVNLKWNEINKDILRKAIINTSKKRDTENYIEDANSYIEMIQEDDRLKSLWNSYVSNYEYAKDITFEDTINAIKVINELVVPSIVN